MANDMWLPTSTELRRQLNAKMMEAEKDFWLTTNEMLQGMLDNIWEATKKGETITMRRGSETVILSPSESAKNKEQERQ